MTSPLFDTQFIQQRKKRAFHSSANDEGHFLINWALEEILDRLNDLTRTFDKTVIHGDLFKTGALKTPKIKSSNHFGSSSVADAKVSNEALPYKKQSQDLIISLFEMHRLNDPLGYLIQSLYALKPDGLFVAAFPGMGSLQELQECISSVEEKEKGGISPRTLPLMSKQDAGHLMQRAGFNLPVVDSETIKLSYTSFKKIFEDIRSAGGGNVLNSRNKEYCGKDFFAKVEQQYRNNYMNDNEQLDATIEILFLSGWAPHDSQQKPLPRGSGQKSLTDVL